MDSIETILSKDLPTRADVNEQLLRLVHNTPKNVAIDVAAVTALIARGADVNIDNGALLRIAAERNDTVLVTALLRDSNILVNSVNIDAHGYTALMTAVAKGHIATVGLLLAAPDINVNSATLEGDTP